MLAALYNGYIYASKCRIKVVFMFAVLYKDCFMQVNAVQRLRYACGVA